MISKDLARRLQVAGLAWDPAPGDAFGIEADQLQDETFVVSDMTIERRDYPAPTGTILAFNGTTEWALDSVRAADALWLPREDQLREVLGGTFRSLRRVAGDDAIWRVTTERGGRERTFDAADPAEAYGLATLELVEAATS